MRSTVVALLLAAIPVMAAAAPPSGGNVPATPGNVTGNPNNFPYPTMPWNWLTRATLQGQPIGFIAVPGTSLTVDLPVATPDGQPPATQVQVLTIPGYYITETTTGYLYPQRWVLEQLTAGVYRWRLLPSEFFRK